MFMRFRCTKYLTANCTAPWKLRPRVKFYVSSSFKRARIRTSNQNHPTIHLIKRDAKRRCYPRDDFKNKPEDCRVSWSMLRDELTVSRRVETRKSSDLLSSDLNLWKSFRRNASVVPISNPLLVFSHSLIPFTASSRSLLPASLSLFSSLSRDYNLKRTGTTVTVNGSSLLQARRLLRQG